MALSHIVLPCLVLYKLFLSISVVFIVLSLLAYLSLSCLGSSLLGNLVLSCLSLLLSSCIYLVMSSSQINSQESFQSFTSSLHISLSTIIILLLVSSHHLLHLTSVLVLSWVLTFNPMDWLFFTDFLVIMLVENIRYLIWRH